MAERVYSEQEASRALGELPSWRAERGAISRTYETEGWGTTLMLVNAIGFVADLVDQHAEAVVAAIAAYFLDQGVGGSNGSGLG